jgi:hypothetical protein
MSGAYREKDQSDFDLEAFIDLFDEALTSNDPGVKQTLQHLMVIAALARNHARHDHRDGPMRRMFENQRDLIRRLDRLESAQQNKQVYPGGGLGGGNVPLGPYYPPTTIGPNTGSSWPSNPGTIPPFPPGTIWGQSGSSTSYSWDPLNSGGTAVAERVEDLLKSSYTGSSVGANDKA